MGRKSIDDVMNEIEDFLNSCKPAALSSNKVVVPRDEFDELFGDLRVKIPAEIERCKKIMRNKEAILMDARKNADGILSQASEQAERLVSDTEVMALANQRAYETVEMARAQANDILAQAVAEANEIRLGSMQYTNDIMMGIRNYVEATMEAERTNYENLIGALENDYLIATANINEVQNQIVDFTGDPSSVTSAPQMKTAAVKKETAATKEKTSVVQKVKQAVGVKEEKKEETKPVVNIPDFITSGESVVPSETPLAATDEVKKKAPQQPAGNTVKNVPENTGKPSSGTTAPVQKPAATQEAAESTGEAPKKVKKKIVKKRNPVLHTPQTAQETVAKTVEAAAAAKVDKTVYKANGEQAREAASVEGRVKRGPRVGRGMVEEYPMTEGYTEVNEADSAGSSPTKSVGVLDDFSMEKKF
ncbi:MAG: hypothetical protein NC300_03240 [Bacteroidales bacterium]|nr:hypothetical protein [Clostridium sp.]MCM1203133.1 hypothetical protein [Bacteroidales bacterium]